MKHTISQLLAAFLLVALAVPATATNTTLTIPMDQIRTRSGARGTFYLVNVLIPRDIVGNRLDMAMIEFAVEATALSESDSVVTPVVGVFPLTREFVDGGQGVNAASPVFKGTVPSARPVALGAKRVLRMDITNIVRGWMNEPSSNHGLVIGSLTGPEVGIVTLKETGPGAETPIRITFFY